MKSKLQSSFTIISVLFTLGISINLYGAKNEIYTISDLEVLSSDNSYIEFFDHAFDIRPSERNDRWKEMLNHMGESYLKALAQKDPLNRKEFQRMESLMAYNTIKQNEFFRQKRQEIGLKWFRQCLSNQSSALSPCWEDLTQYWAPERQEVDLAPRLLSVIAPYLREPHVSDPQDTKQRARNLVSEVFILHPMLVNSISGLQCTKPEIRSVVWAQALKDWEQTLSPQTFVKSLEKWAHPKCWDAVSLWTKKFFKEGASKNELDLAYQLLLLKKNLSSMERDLYFTNYLLNSPAKGDLFNLAWNRIQELGLNPLERDQILYQLKSWRPLPGKIFGDSDLVKRKAISLHLKQHFPEFIDFYAHTCIDFYEGKKRFPQGNPALNCREMFDLAEQEKNFLPLGTVQNFKNSLSI